VLFFDFFVRACTKEKAGWNPKNCQISIVLQLGSQKYGKMFLKKNFYFHISFIAKFG
jgi:hypothetical protein